MRIEAARDFLLNGPIGVFSSFVGGTDLKKLEPTIDLAKFESVALEQPEHEVAEHRKVIPNYSISDLATIHNGYILFASERWLGLTSGFRTVSVDRDVRELHDQKPQPKFNRTSDRTANRRL